jgi:hypothetical protein
MLMRRQLFLFFIRYTGDRNERRKSSGFDIGHPSKDPIHIFYLGG